VHMGDDRERGRNENGGGKSPAPNTHRCEQMLAGGDWVLMATSLPPISNDEEGTNNEGQRQHDGGLTCGATQQGEPGKEGATTTGRPPSVCGCLLCFSFFRSYFCHSTKEYIS
jgi:hypothetical protein